MIWSVTKFSLLYIVTLSAILTFVLKDVTPFAVTVVPALGVLANHKHQETKQITHSPKVNSE
ncbi:MAG: hypothetical protein H8D23_32715 [Candidatus Brocadiales bacterium]|nr:hypothetical protein [Candidatus Brocadiales bacterium]